MNSSKAVVVKDDAPDDLKAADVLQAGLGTFSSIKVRSISQNDPSIEASGRPLIGFGEIVFAPGGSYFHKTVGYLEKQKLIKTTIEVTTGEGGIKGYQFKDINGSIVGDNQSFQSNANEWDFFSIELVVEPKSGSLVVIAYGLWGSGTKAAAYYLVNEILENPQKYTSSWYVFKWENTGDNEPDANDTFTLLAPR
jgi:hypothetical protein